MEHIKSESDKDLVAFLSKCGDQELHILLQAMKSHFSKSSKKLLVQYPKPNSLPSPDTPERIKLSHRILKLLQWYGSNTIAFGSRKILNKGGCCHYHQILRDTAKVLNRSQKRKYRKKLPIVATIDEWEDIICLLLLEATIKQKSPEKIAIMFQEAGLEREAAISAAKQFTLGSVIGISLPLVVKILGKKTVTILLKKILIQLTYKRIGKEAARQLAKRLLVKIPQKTFAKIISGAGWVVLAIDVVFFITSPARRITVPTVAMISALRSIEKLNNMQAK